LRWRLLFPEASWALQVKHSDSPWCAAGDAVSAGLPDHAHSSGVEYGFYHSARLTCAALPPGTGCHRRGSSLASYLLILLATAVFSLTQVAIITIVLLCVPQHWSLRQVPQRYRVCLGIESSAHLLDRVRLRTTSPNEALRFSASAYRSW